MPPKRIRQTDPSSSCKPRKKSKKSANKLEQVKPDLFMKLPAELRNKVYKLVLKPQLVDLDYGCTNIMKSVAIKTAAPAKRQLKGSLHPLLFVSKTIRREALAIFYCLNVIILRVHAHEMFKAYQWLKWVVAEFNEAGLTGSLPALSFCVDLRNVQKKCLDFWFPVAQIARLCLDHKIPFVSTETFRLPKNVFHPAELALFEVSKLGMRAYYERWSDDFLRIQFATLSDNREEFYDLLTLRSRNKTGQPKYARVLKSIHECCWHRGRPRYSPTELVVMTDVSEKRTSTPVFNGFCPDTKPSWPHDPEEKNKTTHRHRRLTRAAHGNVTDYNPQLHQ